MVELLETVPADSGGGGGGSGSGSGSDKGVANHVFGISGRLLWHGHRCIYDARGLSNNRKVTGFGRVEVAAIEGSRLWRRGRCFDN